MAITYIGGHNTDNFTPAFNQVNYYFDSTNKNQIGFRYVVDLYLSGTSTKIWEGRIAPRIGDGYAFVPLQGMLSKQLSPEIDVTVNGSNVPLNWYKFDLKIGEEFSTEWAYTNYGQYTGGGTYDNYTKLYQSPTTAAHTFVVGDKINVAQTDAGVIKPMLEGLFVVVAVPDVYTVVIDIPFSSVLTGATMGGAVKYSDNRKTITRNLNTQTATVYNGALSNADFLTVPNSKFKITVGSVTNRLLTDLPTTGFRSTLLQDIWLNVGNFYTATAVYVYFLNDNWDLLKKPLNASALSAIRQIGVGANNLGSLTAEIGTAPLIKPETKYYDVYIGDSLGNQMTQMYRVEIDRRCAINSTELLFTDRMGSALSFAFQARQTEKFSIKRSGFNKALGGLSGGKWTYANTEGGRTTAGVTTDKEYILRSYWITDEQSVLFEQLLTSPFVLMKLDGTYYRVEIQDSEGTVERAENKPLIKKQITVKMANQNNINA